MISIRLLDIGRDILLPEKFQLQYELLHPSFDSELISGSYTFPIEIENVGINNLLFQFLGDFRSEEITTEYNIEIRRNGASWRRGKLYIDRPGSSFIGGYIRIGLQSFSVLDKKMSEINYGAPIYIGSNILSRQANLKYMEENGNWQLYGFRLPMVYNPDFYGDSNPDFLGFMNNYDTGAGEFIKNEALGAGFSNKNCIVPMFYYMFLLDKIFRNEGYTLYNESDYLNQRAWTRKVLYNNYAIDKYDDPHYSVRASTNPLLTYLATNYFQPLQFQDDFSTGNYDVDNRYSTINFGYKIAVAGLHRVKFKWNYKTGYIPNPLGYRVVFQVRVDSEVIWESQNVFFVGNTSYSFEGPELRPSFGSGDVNKDIRVYMLTNGNLHDCGGYFEVDALENSAINVWDQFIYPHNHVPDITVREFLAAVKKEWQIGFYVDEGARQIRLVPNAHIRDSVLNPFNNEGEKWDRLADPAHAASPNTDKPKLIGYRWPSDDDLVSNNFREYDHASDLGEIVDGNFPTVGVISGSTVVDLYSNKRYVAVTTGTGAIDWQILSDDYYDYLLNPTSSNEYRLDFAPIFMEYVDSNLYPSIRQRGSSPVFTVGINKSAGRMMIVPDGFEGVALASRSITYPFVTAARMIPGINLTGSVGSRFRSIRVNGVEQPDPDELLAECWEWLQFLSANYIYEKEFNLDIIQIDQLEGFNKGIMFPKQIKNTDFILKKVRITLTAAGEQTTVEMIKKPIFTP